VTSGPQISGDCDAKFTRVKEAFAANFDDHQEIGAAVSAFVDGRRVVDLWGGWLDETRAKPWDRDTLVNVFSVGKGMLATLIAILVEEGSLDYDVAVSTYWPEFEQQGKGHVTLRELVSHQAGVPGIRAPLTNEDLFDWGHMTGALAAEAPWWEPASDHGYHVNTLGFLAGEVIRRQSGKSVRELFQEHIAGPIDARFYFGAPNNVGTTIADFVFPNINLEPQLLTDGSPWGALVYANPPGMSGIGIVNTSQWRVALHPSTNGHSNARSLAKIYNVLAHDGSFGNVHLLRPESLRHATSEVVVGDDLVLQRPSRFGCGFQLTQIERPIGPNEHTFGHFGAGGSLGFADPEACVSFGYTMNRFGHRWQDPRNKALIAALYESL
jgi:CubicO group peptidase (beta-lactamase class C family)